MRETETKAIAELSAARKDDATLKARLDSSRLVPKWSGIDRWAKLQPEKIPTIGSGPSRNVAEVLLQGLVHCRNSTAIAVSQGLDVRIERTVVDRLSNDERADVVDATATVDKAMTHDSGSQAFGGLNPAQTKPGCQDF